MSIDNKRMNTGNRDRTWPTASTTPSDSNGSREIISRPAYVVELGLKYSLKVNPLKLDSTVQFQKAVNT